MTEAEKIAKEACKTQLQIVYTAEELLERQRVRIEKVRAIHVLTRGYGLDWCAAGCGTWPCYTIDALNDAEPEGR